jgi:Ca2+-binding RTX toxin-like protein
MSVIIWRPDYTGIYGTVLADTLVASDNTAHYIRGYAGDDLLKGAGGNDVLLGDDGDDTLKGGGGADYLHGGAGYDTVSYTQSQTRVFVSLADNVGAYGDAAGDTFTFIENITGTQYNDDLWGHNGNNVLNGMLGNDNLKGFGGNDTLRGEAGNDVLDGGLGADTMIGGIGNDTYLVDNFSDAVSEFGGEGADVVRTSVSYILPYAADVETLETTDPNGTAPLFLYGNYSGNNIFGNNGANEILGGYGGGADQMTGRGGNDTYYVYQASDRVIENGGQGNDTVYANVSWTLTAGSDVELLATWDDLGTAAIDLTGNANGNVVRGNNGNNTLNGGDGRDDLTGLGGQDQYLFDTRLNAAVNVDTLSDFSVADDAIVLENTIFSVFAAGPLAAERFIVGTAALDASDNIIYNSATGALLYDSDGNGATAAIQFAQLAPGLALTQDEFLIV